jgi:hypothetical protein
VKKTRASRFKNVIGHRVREARLASKPQCSQEDLCGRLARQGVQLNQASLSKLENRQRYVLDYEIVALAKALKLKVGWLFGEH